jgi:hypothetical protein
LPVEWSKSDHSQQVAYSSAWLWQDKQQYINNTSL